MEKVIGEKLLELKKHFEKFREENGGKRPLPQSLWNDATQVAQLEGIGATAKVLRLNYSKLKNLVDHAPTKRVKHEAEATFVQLQMPISKEESTAVRLIIELATCRGNRMRIDTCDSSSVDVIGLAQAFWSQAS